MYVCVSVCVCMCVCLCVEAGRDTVAEWAGRDHTHKHTHIHIHTHTHTHTHRTHHIRRGLCHVTAARPNMGALGAGGRGRSRFERMAVVGPSREGK